MPIQSFQFFMGLPIREMGLDINFVCAVNSSNDVVARLLESGVYSVAGGVRQTLASAMDIQVNGIFTCTTAPAHQIRSFDSAKVGVFSVVLGTTTRFVGF